jgi:putative membrane protein
VAQKLLTSLMLCFVAMHPLQAFAQQTQAPPVPQPPQGYYWPAPWHMWGDGYGWHFWWMFLLMMLFMVVIFAVIFFLARGFSGHGYHHWGPPSHTMNRSWGDPSYSALQILNERFARGEIQKDEYTEKKAAILSSGQS